MGAVVKAKGLNARVYRKIGEREYDRTTDLEKITTTYNDPNGIAEEAFDLGVSYALTALLDIIKQEREERARKRLEKQLVELVELKDGESPPAHQRVGVKSWSKQS